jgi:hypothetical protein
VVLAHQRLQYRDARRHARHSQVESGEPVIPHLILLFSVLDGDRPF